MSDPLLRFGGSAPLAQQFRTQGFVLLDSCFSDEELRDIDSSIVQPLLRQADSLHGCDGSDWNDLDGSFVFEDSRERAPAQASRPRGRLPGARLLKVQGVALRSELVVPKVFSHPAVVHAVRAILGGGAPGPAEPGDDPAGLEIDCFGTKLYPVWPNGGRSVGWHADTHYFGTDRKLKTRSELILSCAVYLDAADRENGCFKICPGTQELPEDPEHQLKTNEGEWIGEDEMEQLGMGERGPRLFQRVDVPVSAGSVVLFDARAVHGAHPNMSRDRPRKSLFAHYVGSGHTFSWRGVDFSFGKYKDRHRIVGQSW